MAFLAWAQRLDNRVLGPVPPWRETRPRDMFIWVAFPAVALVVGLALFVFAGVTAVTGLIGYGIGGLLVAYPAYRLRKRLDRRRREGRTAT